MTVDVHNDVDGVCDQALTYWGRHLFSEEKCGDAVSCFRAAEAGVWPCHCVVVVNIDA